MRSKQLCSPLSHTFRLQLHSNLPREFTTNLQRRHRIPRNRSDTWWGEEIICAGQNRPCHPEDNMKRELGEQVVPIIHIQRGNRFDMDRFGMDQSELFTIKFASGIQVHQMKVAFVYLRNLFPRRRRQRAQIYCIPKMSGKPQKGTCSIPYGIFGEEQEPNFSIRHATEDFYKQCMFCGQYNTFESWCPECVLNAARCGLEWIHPLPFPIDMDMSMLLLTECMVRKDLCWYYTFNRGILFTSIFDKYMEMEILFDLFTPEMYIYTKWRTQEFDEEEGQCTSSRCHANKWIRSTARRRKWKEYTLHNFFGHTRTSKYPVYDTVSHAMQALHNHPRGDIENVKSVSRKRSKLLRDRVRQIKAVYFSTLGVKHQECCCRNVNVMKSHLKEPLMAYLECQNKCKGFCRGGK